LIFPLAQPSPRRGEKDVVGLFSMVFYFHLWFTLALTLKLLFSNPDTDILPGREGT